MKKRQPELNLWCLSYDQNSYHQPFTKINIKKYLEDILCSKYFDHYQRQLAKEIKDQSYWNMRCWTLVQFFQYLNQAFSSENMEQNMLFVPEENLRKAFGTFQMWIDLERLYLFSFLKLDRIQFQEDRIYFALFRALFFTKEFLLQHLMTDFRPGFLEQISNNIKIHALSMQKAIPDYMVPLSRDISLIIDYFLQDQKVLIPPENEATYRKIAFHKIVKLKDMIHEIQSRLQTNAQYLSKERKEEEIKKITNQSYLDRNLPPSLYDEDYNALKRTKQNFGLEGEKLEQVVKEYKRKQKQRIPSQNPYQSLMRVRHNPYEETNYAIYGQILGVDMNQKRELQKVSQQEIIEDKIENDTSSFYYQKDYVDFALSLDSSYGNVKETDLSQSVVTYMETQKKSLAWKDTSKGKISNLVWEKGKHKDRKSDASEMKGEYKDISNNVLFPSHDQDEEKIEEIVMMKKAIKSNVLYNMEKKAEQYYERPSQAQMYNIERNCLEDRHKFDELRKLLLLTVTEKKIENAIKSKSVPSYYPRSIEVFKDESYFSTINSLKIQNALGQM